MSLCSGFPYKEIPRGGDTVRPSNSAHRFDAQAFLLLRPGNINPNIILPLRSTRNCLALSEFSTTR
jgi:hypothetical protein